MATIEVARSGGVMAAEASAEWLDPGYQNEGAAARQPH
jgi:hypothetical protein